jgi:hypothetical protein
VEKAAKDEGFAERKPCGANLQEKVKKRAIRRNIRTSLSFLAEGLENALKSCIVPYL